MSVPVMRGMENLKTALRLLNSGLDAEAEAKIAMVLDEAARAIGPDTGHLLNILVRSLSAPIILELGTSFGYSGIWLSDWIDCWVGDAVSMIGDFTQKVDFVFVDL
nr:hypothetical protein [Gluconobacter sphaericus]